MNKYISKQNKPEDGNRIFARGKIVNLNPNGSNYDIELFIRNGGGRQHTYLHFNCSNIALQLELKTGTTIHVYGHVENYIDIRNKPAQKYVADIITPEKTELARYFRKEDFQFGFAPQRHFAKFFVAGEVTRVINNTTSKWIVLSIKDASGNIVNIQFSRRMRVADNFFKKGDYVYAYAIPISTKKNISGQDVNFITLIAEDIEIG
ncbi:TPA: hypothetical protein ACGO5H_001847 [Streptococcus suis]|nr:hypothetical protein [Streptococcus suis]NQI34946.1 hypothetical protein [Streptococcus suis]NQP20302.1 hypothetical protein [Streptococcus suis]NQP64926.1 hypothetical protein [Streptococcus suis]HEM4927520.1 hypothetical protein [Streptococcus suis]